jgi:hypothetical protein
MFNPYFSGLDNMGFVDIGPQQRSLGQPTAGSAGLTYPTSLSGQQAKKLREALARCCTAKSQHFRM